MVNGNDSTPGERMRARKVLLGCLVVFAFGWCCGAFGWALGYLAGMGR